ncbi:MAG: hypothetical protein K9N23_04050 [Akkermansiaceae bacterium]|nr:hypothetical protein [Akkermansiaceae bacterium]
MNKKTVGAVLMGLGIIGFFGGNMLKSRSQILEEKLTSVGPHSVTLPVTAGKSYTVFLWGRDEKSESLPGFAGMEFSAKVIGADRGKVIFEQASVSASASSSEAGGGIKRAQNGCEFTATAETSGNWTLQIDLKTGDEVTVDAYQGLSVFHNLAPGLAIICGLIGLILFLKGRAAAAAP